MADHQHVSGAMDSAAPDSGDSRPHDDTRPDESAALKLTRAIAGVRTRVTAALGLVLCTWQALATVIQNDGNKHLVVLAQCGAGKTLAFLAPLLFEPEHVVFVISPLLSLGHQHVSSFLSYGMTACEITSQTFGKDLLSVVILSPEMLVIKEVRDILDREPLATRLARLIFDEAHCIEEWGLSFRFDYLDLDLIVSRLRSHVRFVLASPTLARSARLSTMRRLGMSPESTTVIQLESTCGNVFRAVKRMLSSTSDYSPMHVFLPDDPMSLPPDCAPPPKFMVFMQSKQECMEAATYLLHLLPPHHHDKICWYHSDKTDGYKDSRMDAFTNGKVWGMFCTDAAGLGLNITTVVLGVQWGIRGLAFSALSQRGGRAGRNRAIQSLFLLYVDNKYYALDEPTDKSDEPEAKRRKVEIASSGDVVSQPSPPEDRATARLQGLDPLVVEYAGLANAETVPPGSHGRCRRATEAVVYTDPDASSVPDDPTHTCSRCSPPPPAICCDYSIDLTKPPPDFPPWMLRILTYEPPPKVSAPRKTVPLRKHVPAEAEHMLEAYLRKWRVDKCASDFAGESFGPAAILSDGVIERIVLVAHRRVISDPASLERETAWLLSNDYGKEIVALVNAAFPEPPTRATRGKALPTCSNCHTVGHSKNQMECPLRDKYLSELAQKRAAAAGKENPTPKRVASASSATHPGAQGRARIPLAPLPSSPYGSLLPQTPTAAQSAEATASAARQAS